MAEESSLTQADRNHLMMNLAPNSFSCPMTLPLTRANPWCCRLFPRCHVLQALAAMETGAFPSSIPTQALSHCCIFVTVTQGPSRVTQRWVGRWVENKCAKLNKDSLYFQEHYHPFSSLMKRLSFMKPLKPSLITCNHYSNHKICFLLYCVNEAL